VRDLSHDRRRVVGDRKGLDVLKRERPSVDGGLTEPVHKATPVRGSHENDWKRLETVRASEVQRLEELVERPEPTWKDYKRAAVPNERELAEEKVVERYAKREEGVGRLVER
jgi:hypothetical protein